MMKKSYPIYFLYCTKDLEKNQLLFNPFTKNEWIEELTNIDSNIYYFIKDEVEELFFNTGGYLQNLDFESVYKLSVDITVSQIKKSSRKQKKCFFERDYSNIWSLLKQRLVNNSKNLFDNKRKINLISMQHMIIDDIHENFEDNFIISDLKKLAKVNPELIIRHIKNLSKSFQLSFTEIEEIGEKIEMNLSNLFQNDFELQMKIIGKETNNQLFFNFNNVKVS